MSLLEVYGINLLVRLVADDKVAVRLHCPKGAVIRYGEVVMLGDRLDADGCLPSHAARPGDCRLRGQR
jgi:hypothetical protein